MKSLSLSLKWLTFMTTIGCLLFLLGSCSNEVGPSGGFKGESLGQKTELKNDAEIAKAFLGKWPVPEGRYESFEFLPNGLFMVVERKNSSRPAPGNYLRKTVAASKGVHYGSWKVVNGKVVLNGFGEIIDPKTYAGSDVRLGFTVANRNGLFDVLTEMAADIVIDDNTKNLSKVWLSRGVYTDAALTQSDAKASAKTYTVLFTRAGTYFVLDSNDPGAIEAGSSEDTRYAEWSGSFPNITYTWSNGVSGDIAVVCLNNSSLPSCPSGYNLVVREGDRYYAFEKLPDAGISQVSGGFKGSAKILNYFDGCTYVWKADGQDIACSGTDCQFEGNCEQVSFKVVCGEDYESDVTTLDVARPPVLTCAVGGTKSGIKGVSFTATNGYTATCSNGTFTGTVQWKLGGSNWGTGANMGTANIPNLNGNQDVKVSANCGGTVQEVTCSGGQFEVQNATLTCGAEITGNAGTTISVRPALTCNNGQTPSDINWSVSGAPNWSNPVANTFTFKPTANCGIATGLATTNNCSVKVNASSVPTCQYNSSWCGGIARSNVIVLKAGSYDNNNHGMNIDYSKASCFYVQTATSFNCNGTNLTFNNSSGSGGNCTYNKGDNGIYIYKPGNYWWNISSVEAPAGGVLPQCVASSSSSSTPPTSSSSSVGGGSGCSVGAKVVEASGPNFNTGNLDVGAVCVKITGNVQGCGLSNANGRTCKVNGNIYTNGKPDVAGDGFTYIDCSAGDYSYFAIYCY